MADEYQSRFKALQSEFEAESVYLLTPTETNVGHVRVFNDKGGLVRLDIQVVKDGETSPSEHVQIIVGQSSLMRRLAQPQGYPPQDT